MSVVALRGPLLVAGAVGAAAVLVAVRDPRSTTYLTCPIHAVTGVWCPGCGATRAFGDLVRGDVASATASNMLFVLLAVVGLGLWAAWVRARLRSRPLFSARPPVWLLVAGVATVVAFTVVRNIPAGSWLAP
ncbi:DUF2752 domain-containing protein [Rhodococcoides kyotonense]|uniref:DUF2752 domain-containing protein n=1 Tax=Rhodococcoides kyotonense TaxID=398843 RepID=A0A177YL21_9NOCA|nr:DUF2752 domain-containing protein [Rhodococcus kyotonensis]OAK55950.1 hypothetical protein A3K89_18755 [Rhodococcus kyotonensis]